MGLQLLSLNIERSAHLARFLPFIQQRQLDVICLQELLESDIDAIQHASGLAHCHFAPMARTSPAERAPFGVGIFSRQPFIDMRAEYYAGGGDGTTLIDRASAESRLATMRYAAVTATIAHRGQTMTIATTHFPWTADGQPRPFQTEAAENLIALLPDEPLIFCGDFNAPRGGPIFDRFAERWSDCIPKEITTSIDPKLHRAGPLELMVDGLFASHGCLVSHVIFHCGLSDHQGITATIDLA